MISAKRIQPISLAWLAFGLAACISDRSYSELKGGDGTETGNARILGRLVDDSGAPIAQAQVTAYSTNHDPSTQTAIPASQQTTTKMDGTYSFDSIPFGVWNLEARDPSRRLAHLLTGVEFSESDIHLGDEVLQTPGTITVDLGDEKALSGNSYLYVSGTSAFALIDSQAQTGASTILYDVPSGNLPKVILVKKDEVGQETRISIADSLYLAPGGQARVTPYMSWKNHVRIDLALGANGIQLKESLKGFTFPIRLTSDLMNFSQANSDGSDLRVTSSTFKTLKISLEHFEPQNQSGLLWVEINSLPAGSSQEYVTLHYGHPESHSARAIAFDTLNGFSGVWHLSEEAAGTTMNGLYWDATLGGNNGNDRISNPMRNGVLGYGKSFFNGDYVQYPGLKKIFQPESTFTVQAWVRCTGTGPLGGNIVSMGDNYGLQITNTGELFVYIWPSVYRPLPDPPYYLAMTMGANLVDSKWHHVVGTFGNKQLTVYVDGVAKGSSPFTGRPGYTLAMNISFGISGNQLTDYNFIGDMDEVEIHNVLRSPEWIRASYESQRPGGLFLKPNP